MEAMRTCQKCKGKGWLFKRDSVLLTIYLPIAMALEWIGDYKEGITRKICPKCDGEGEVE